MAGDRRHGLWRQTARPRRPAQRAHWKAARGIEAGMDWAKQRLSFVPPWCPERGIVLCPEQLTGWLGVLLTTFLSLRARAGERDWPCALPFCGPCRKTRLPPPALPLTLQGKVLSKGRCRRARCGRQKWWIIRRPAG